MVAPDLKPLTGETMNYQSAITTDEGRLDIRAQGFWGVRSEKAYFDVKVFNPFSRTYRDKTHLSSLKLNNLSDETMIKE